MHFQVDWGIQFKLCQVKGVKYFKRWNMNGGKMQKKTPKQKRFSTNKLKKAYCHLLEGSHTDFGQLPDFPPVFFYRDKERSQIKLPNP